MAKINDIEGLRDYVLESMDKLSKSKIDVTELGVIAKSSETIMSSLKLQLAYAGMLNEEPKIAFLQKCHVGKQKVIEGSKAK